MSADSRYASLRIERIPVPSMCSILISLIVHPGGLGPQELYLRGPAGRMAWRALAWKAATLIEPGRELWASFERSNEACCVMKCVRVVGAWRVEVKGLTAFVASVLRAGITR